MQKEVRIVIKVIFFLFMTVLYSQKQYVKFDFTKENDFTSKDFIDKRVNFNKIYFTKGIETLGKVDEFLFNSKEEDGLSINCKDLNSIEFINVDNLKTGLKIYVVEITKEEIKVYPVNWSKKEYIE